MKRILLGFALATAAVLASHAQAETTVSPGVTTEIEINVYKLYGQAPFWHTGTVIPEGDTRQEFYFDDTNMVVDDTPGEFNSHHHRTIKRTVQGDEVHVKSILDEVKARWNGSRYDVSEHNCNRFTNDLLIALGSTQLDSEYLECSGIAKAFGQTPGAAFILEASKQATNRTLNLSHLQRAQEEDLNRLGNLPKDTASELGREAADAKAATDNAVAAAKKAGGKAASSAKKAGGKAASSAKKSGGKAASSAKKSGGKAASSAKKSGGKAASSAKKSGGKVANATKKARKNLGI